MTTHTQRERHGEALARVKELERELLWLRTQYELAVYVAEQARRRSGTARRYLTTITSEMLSMEELNYAIALLDGRAP